MIIILIILFTLLTFFGFMFVKNRAGRLIAGGLSLVLLVLSVFALTFHFNQHWGMKEVVTTSSHQIYTAGDAKSAYGLMIKSEIGKNTGNYALVFRNNENAAKPDTNFVPDEKHIIEAVKKTASYKLVDSDKAKVVTTTTRRQFSSSWMKLLFGVGGEENTLVKESSVVEVPKDTWLVLTEDQVEKLTKEAPEMQKQMEAQLKADPAKALQMAELQKSNPKAYAKLQVDQIKQLLGIKD